MNNLSKLYKPENKVLLETISLLNFAIGFDKSIASFKESDLFGFLERVQNYDFKNYDDLFYILDMFEDSFWHISQYISSQIRRTHVVMPISRAKELDSKSIGWIARQNGITIQQKLAQGKVLGVKRYGFRDNPENRVLKIVLMRLVAIAEFRAFDEGLRNKIVQFIRNNLNEVNHKAQITPNNILLHHKHYAKFYKIYKWLNHLEHVMSDFQSFKRNVNITRENLKKFIALSLLHKNTNVRILPSDLSYSQKDYSVHFETKWLLDCDIEKYLNSENDLKSFKNKCLNFIETNNALKHIAPPPDKINSSKSKIFIDIFRLYPMLYVNSKYIAMPLLLKQKINNKIINANHTKIIDMNNPFYTLAESLLLKNSEVFNVFLRDIKEFVGESNILYYILPDYINVFDFNDKHKSIRAYFNQAFFINKSILAAAKMLFNGELKEKDTLLYFQKNNMEEIYVTPILVRYKDELKESKSKGLYLEKHPSKQYKNNIKNKDKIVQKLLKKCLQNGVKALVQNNIKYYKNNRIYDIPKLPKEEVNNDIHEVKLLYKNSHDLFKSDIKIIQDDPKENLEYYKELIEQKENGFILWGEKLPKLDMGVSDGIKDEKFNLVNDNDELDFKNEICIKDQFIIPANAEKIIAPLFLEDKNINYSMVLESDMMPFKEEVRCRLTLQYSYDDENIYTLIFRPLDGNLQQMQAKWHKGVMKQIRKDMSHIYPPYPPIKRIDELQHYPKKDGSGENNLFEWVETSIKNIQQLTPKKVQATVYSIKKDYCFAKDVLRHEVICYKDQFINQTEWENIKEGDGIFLIKEETKKGYKGELISTRNTHIQLSPEKIKQATKILYSMRFPMISIFNGHSLRADDMPNSFRTNISNFIEFMDNKNINDDTLKNEFLLFCSMMHDCSPIGQYLVDNFKDIKNHRLLAYSIGDAKQPWQEKILQLVFEDKFIKQIPILAISLWRSENLVFDKIHNDKIHTLINESIQWMNNIKTPVYQPKDSKIFLVTPLLVNILEVLLSLLRLRQKGFDILNPSDKNTKELIQKLIELNEFIMKKQVVLRSYLNLEVKKPSAYEKMPNLIYALISLIKGENSDSIKIIGVNDGT
ncbi:DUF2357 domain-containing protein [Campylobacter sp. US33a]|uniref:DUF2357 domain-containing protein n=1 Tax=Campylobacter sp. US33a TaxID=2498120 RepID=UPI001067E348|nr:hypothetical protein [Campylobacter sp. US33a]TEY02329.1 hypothetical protein ELQ16_05475 [Campylobacter sp. US33a]